RPPRGSGRRRARRRGDDRLRRRARRRRAARPVRARPLGSSAVLDVSANGRGPAAVVFDLDGLLLDTETVWTRAETALFAQYGRTFGPAEKRRLIGTSGATAARILEDLLDLPGEGSALSATIRKLVWVELEAGAAAQPGAVELVAALVARGTPIG